jgi:hypothetical protein
VTLEDEAFVLCLDERKPPRNTGENGAYAASDDLLESFDEREFFLVERGVFGDGEDRVGGVPFLQLDCDVIDEEFVAGNGQAVLGIEVCEVRELVGELVTQAWVGEDLPVTVPFTALHECRDECLLVVHGRSLAQNPEWSANRATYAVVGIEPCPAVLP